MLEVSYSQDGKDLRKLASGYILRSNGDIKVVVGIDINNGKESTVSLWRPFYVQEDDEEVEILQVVQEVAYKVSHTNAMTQTILRSVTRTFGLRVACLSMAPTLCA